MRWPLLFGIVAVGCTDLGGQAPDAAVEPDADIGAIDGGTIVDVEMRDMRFVPDEIEIAPGMTVRWTNFDTGARHSATAVRANNGAPPEWDSGLFVAGESWQRTFVEAGDEPYYCSIHSWMTGTVHVR